MIDTWLTSHGLIQSQTDTNLYYSNKNDKLAIFLIYVNGLLIIGNDNSKIAGTKVALQHNFEMMDLDTTENYFKIEIEYHSSKIFLHQRTYIIKVLQCFGLPYCNSTKLPKDLKI